MPTNEIYKLRSTFSIIGLTGRTGSGCTRFAEIISKDAIKFKDNPVLRKPSEVRYLNYLSDKNTVFKRNYTVCYNFFQKNYKQYTTISYIDVLFLYILHYVVNKLEVKTKCQLIDSLFILISENFMKSIEPIDSDYENVEISKDEILNLDVDFDKIIELIFKLKYNICESSKEDLYSCFFEGPVKEFTNKFFMLLGSKDYYLGSFFVHRIGNKIRATGDPYANIQKLEELASTKNIYNLVSIINILIKAYKKINYHKPTHICIDSLRNSLELMFLKERYAAFYMITIHSDDRREERISKRILHEKYSNPNNINLSVSKVINLDVIENRSEDFKKGLFFAPDVENCIQKSDIHLCNPGKNIASFDSDLYDSSFYTMIEQWTKIHSLILHPGLITPTHDERCMQIAFISKFNSGCISRQVGAVITDRNNSIRSVGWNDVPKGSIPCNLRDLNDIINPNQINKDDLSYSSFEIKNNYKFYKDGGSFSSKTKEEFSVDVAQTNLMGLAHSFCFKSLHNRYEGKENQVHTRSLHAEENAMLQISKYGGQALDHGTLYTTASPCELCAKKAYQLGLKIVYIDPYPGISMDHILKNGYNQPKTKIFSGIVGIAYNRLYEPLLSYKDELTILNKHK